MLIPAVSGPALGWGNKEALKEPGFRGAVKSTTLLRLSGSHPSVSTDGKNPWIQKANCIHCNSPLNVRNVSIPRFCYPLGLLEPISGIPRDGCITQHSKSVTEICMDTLTTEELEIERI